MQSSARLTGNLRQSPICLIAILPDYEPIKRLWIEEVGDELQVNAVSITRSKSHSGSSHFIAFPAQLIGGPLVPMEPRGS